MGSLTGLGGGVVITPVLTLMLGVDIHLAMGATLISVIATSSGAAAAYVREGFTNVRVGMFLEIATTMGAIAGAHLTAMVPTPALAVVFGCDPALFGVAILPYSGRSAGDETGSAGASPAAWRQLSERGRAGRITRCSG